MKKLNLTLSSIVATVLGVVGGQANAKVSSEEELFRATLDTGTIEAAEVFRQKFPDSNRTTEIDSLITDLIRAEHTDAGFDGKSTDILVARRNSQAWGKGHGSSNGKGHGPNKPGKRNGHRKHGGGY